MRRIKTNGKVLFMILSFGITGFFSSGEFFNAMAEENSKELILIDPTKAQKRHSQKQRFGPITPSPQKNSDKPSRKNSVNEIRQEEIQKRTNNSIEYIKKRYAYQIHIMKQLAEDMQIESENMNLPESIIEAKEGYIQEGKPELFFMGEKTIFSKEEQLESRIKQAMQNWEKKNPPPEEIKMIDKRIKEDWKKAKNGEMPMPYLKEAQEEIKRTKDSRPIRNGIQSDGSGLG